MSLTVTLDPTNPIVGNSVVLIASTSVVGVYHQYEFTSVPKASSLPIGLIVDAAGSATNSFIADAAGTYSIIAHDFVKVFGKPRYEGSPSGGPRVTQVNSASLTFPVGDSLSLPIKTIYNDGANLSLSIVNNVVTSAAFDSFANDISERASRNSFVLSAISAITGLSVSSIGGDILVRTKELRTAFGGHVQTITIGGSVLHLVGASGTTSTSVTAPYTDGPESLTDAIYILNYVRTGLQEHSAKKTYQSSAWHTTDDNISAPYVKACVDRPTAVVLLSHLREQYRNHSQYSLRSIITATNFTVGTETWSAANLNGVAGNGTFYARKLAAKFFSGVDNTQTMSFIGLDPYGVSVIDSVPTSVGVQYGSVYFTQVNKITTTSQTGGSFFAGFAPQVHDVSDTTNTILAATPLENVIATYIHTIQSIHSPAPTNDPTGLHEASHLYGFSK